MPELHRHDEVYLLDLGQAAHHHGAEGSAVWPGGGEAVVAQASMALSLGGLSTTDVHGDGASGAGTGPYHDAVAGGLS
jgi:hypothetical protein